MLASIDRSSPEARYAALSDSEQERIVEEVLKELGARGYTVGPFEAVDSFEHSSDRFKVTFTYGVDPAAMAIVRKHVDDLPLEVVDLLLLRITTAKARSIEHEVYSEGLKLIAALNTLELRVGDTLTTNVTLLNINSTANITFAAGYGQITLRVSGQRNETIYRIMIIAPGPTAPYPILRPGNTVDVVFCWNTSENILNGDRPPSPGKYYVEVEISVTDLDTHSKTMLRTNEIEVNLSG